MFPVRTVALMLAVFAGTAFGQNTSPDKNPEPQKAATPQDTAAPAQPQTKVLVPESDAATANSAADSNDPLLSVPPLPKGKTTLLGGQVRNIDQIRNHVDVDSFGGGHMRVNFDERTQPAEHDYQPRFFLWAPTLAIRSRCVESRPVPEQVLDVAPDAEAPAGEPEAVDVEKHRASPSRNP